MFGCDPLDKSTRLGVGDPLNGSSVASGTMVETGLTVTAGRCVMTMETGVRGAQLEMNNETMNNEQ